MFNSLLNTLWPVKELVDFIFTSIFADVVKCKDSKEDVEREIKSKTFYEISDLEISAKTFNKKFLTLSPIQLISGSIEKLYIKFPKNYFKEKIEIRLENVKLIFEGNNFDLDQFKENIRCVVKETLTVKNELPTPMQKIINNILNNLEIEIKNILVEYLQEEEVSKDILNKNSHPITEIKKYSESKIKFLIGSILYTKLKDNTKDAFFLFNKQILFYDLYIKIANNNVEDDKTQIKSSLAEKQIEKITDKSCILVTDANDSDIINNSNLINYRDLNCSIWFKFMKDESEKDSLLIDTNLNKIEMILTKNHTEFLVRALKRLITRKNNIFKFNEEKEKKVITHKDNVILTHKITNIKHTLNITNLNFVLLENITSEDLSKPKMWLLYEQYFKKYYLSFDDRIKDNFNINSIENIQKHFSYLEDNFFLINISNLIIKSNFNLTSYSLLKPDLQSTIIINEMNTRYIEPNNKSIKKDFVLVKNPCAIIKEAELFFDEKYSKFFINSIRYGYSSFIITSMEKINVKINIRNLENITLDNSYRSCEFIISMNEIKTEINEFVLLKIYYYIMTNLATDKRKNQAVQELTDEKVCIHPSKLSSEYIESNNSEIKDERQIKPDYNTEDTSLKNSGNILYKIDNESITPDYVSDLEHSFEIKVIFTFKLTVAFSQFSQSNLLFKEFYNTYIHLPNDNTFSYNPRRIFKIGDNLKNKENITIRVNPGELIIHKKPREQDLNLYLDIGKIFFFYNEKNIYFPVITYKNSLFFPINQDDIDFANIVKLKKWTAKLISINKFNEHSSEDFDMKHAMNSHHITSHDSLLFDQLNAYNILKFIKTNHKHIESRRKIEIELNLNKFEILINYSNFNNLVDHLKISCFYFQYFQIFELALQNKIENKTLKSDMTDVKKYFENLSVFIELDEINIVAFSHLNAYYDGFNQGKGNFLNEGFLSSINEAERYLINEENIFNIIENPFLKLQFFNFHFTQFKVSSLEGLFIFSLENFKILIRKNENIYHDTKIKHQIYYQNIYEEENFECILHKGMTKDKAKRNLILMLINFKIITDKKNEDIKLGSVGEEFQNFEDFVRKFLDHKYIKSEFKITSVISTDDLVLCPLFSNFEQSIKLIQHLKKENFKQKYVIPHHSLKKENSYDRSIHSLKDEIKTIHQEIIFNEKLFNLNQNLNESDQKNRNNSKGSSDYFSKSSNVETNSFKSDEMMKTKYDLNLTLHIARVVLDLYSHVDDKSKMCTKVEQKDKMRLIIEIEGIKYEDIIRDSSNDLNILNSNGSNTVLPSDSDIYPRSISLKISKINSIFLKNLDYSRYAIASLTNRCQNIYKENSYWRKVGFSEIINIDSININLNKVSTNFKLEMIFNMIEFNFCKDSFKYFKKFLERSKIDLELLKAALTEMPELILNEIESSHEKHNFSVDKLKILNINDNLSKFNQNIPHNLDKMKSAEINLKANEIYLKDLNLNSRNKEIGNRLQSYSLNPEDHVLILDKNSEHCSILDSDRKINFNSNSFYQTDLKDGESLNGNQSISHRDLNEGNINKDNNHDINRDKNNSSRQISERLNLLFVVNNFKFYLLEGKDFLFEDKYSEITMIHTDNSLDENTFENSQNNKIRTYSETVKTQGDCNITISLNPNTIKIIDDYLMTGGISRESNRKQEEINRQISNCRMKKNQRNYSSYLCFNAENVEVRLFYYRYDRIF